MLSHIYLLIFLSSLSWACWLWCRSRSSGVYGSSELVAECTAPCALDFQMVLCSWASVPLCVHSSREHVTPEMNKLRQSLRRKKPTYVPEASRPHQWQADEEAVRKGKCNFPVRVSTQTSDNWEFRFVSMSSKIMIYFRLKKSHILSLFDMIIKIIVKLEFSVSLDVPKMTHKGAPECFSLFNSVSMVIFCDSCACFVCSESANRIALTFCYWLVGSRRLA